MYFIPEKGVYEYFRYDNRQIVVCVMNTNENQATLDLTRFAERINVYTRTLDIAT